MSTNPFDMDDLLGAYALDAVDDDERRAVEDYLAASPRARAEVQDHREVATMLAWSGMDAPEGLWDRIAGALEGSASAPETELAHVMPMRQSRRKAWSRTVGSWTVATAAAALIAVVAVRISHSDNATPSAAGCAVEQSLADPHSLQAQLTSSTSADLKVRAVVDPSGNGCLLASSLPALDAEHTYQLWGKVNGTVVSLGVLGPHPKAAAFTVDGHLTLLAITAEKAGGVAVSSNPMLLSGATA